MQTHRLNPEHVNGKSGGHNGHRVRHQINKDGQRQAVLQALTAAMLYLANSPLAPTLAIAARRCGSTVSYTRAAIVILQCKDVDLQEQVLEGGESLLAVARQMKPITVTLKAYDAIDAEAKNTFLRKCGTDRVLNDLAAAEARGEASPMAVPTMPFTPMMSE